MSLRSAIPTIRPVPQNVNTQAAKVTNGMGHDETRFELGSITEMGAAFPLQDQNGLERDR